MTTDATSGDRDDLRGARIVLGVSGGIAAYKAVMLARLLVQAGAVVDPVLTAGATRFVGAATFEGITGRRARTEVWEDVDTETHVALARAADAVVVYPATAHTMARAASGLADDLLTTTLLAATCPVLLAPAMHTEMWQHPATQHNADVLRQRGAHLLGPAEGELMGGDSGMGRAIEPEQVMTALRDLLAGTITRDLDGRTFVVTAGGTRERIDPVRFLGNRSSGRMGFAIAAAAARRGAVVHLVAGPTHLATPAGVTRHDITTAREMHAVVLELAETADVVVKAAAVADFRPVEAHEHKLRKSDGIPQIKLERNPDILAALGQHKRDAGTGPLLVGFAAETRDVEQTGRDKLARKGADLLVVNDVGSPDAGFEVDTNRVIVLAADGDRLEVPLASKAVVAHAVLDAVARRLSGALG